MSSHEARQDPHALEEARWPENMPHRQPKPEMSTTVTEFHECEDCHEEACFEHRYQTVAFNFCDQHSLSELHRDLARQQRGDIPNDLIEVVWLDGARPRCTCPLDPDDPDNPYGAREVVDGCPIHGMKPPERAHFVNRHYSGSQCVRAYSTNDYYVHVRW
jgi:hypothetical protein